MVVDFSKLDLTERPVLVLKNAAGEPIGTLGAAFNVRADIKYNEASVIEFDLPQKVEGVPTPYYDAVVGMRLIELPDIGQFVLVNPVENDAGIRKVKSCKAYSLEYEFTFKHITLENATYNFWNPVTPDSTLMGIIMDEMPGWHVGRVDDALVGRYRTFEVANENVYNFMKGTVQNAYGCIFEFDTFNRLVNARDVSEDMEPEPVYLSNANLAKEIQVTENTENIITRLEVNGADGVNIRDVNPSGTNYIINLDYFMTPDNFDQALIDKYYAWKESYRNQQLPYYNLTVEYMLQVMRKTTEQAALTELNGELTSLENQQAVIIQSIARGLMSQSDLDAINVKIKAKQDEIKAKQGEIDAIDKQAQAIHTQLAAINDRVNFERYFTADEYLILSRYLKDDAVSESSFVVKQTQSYTDEDIGNPLAGESFAVDGSAVTWVTNSAGKDIYDIKGGKFTSGFTQAEVVKGAFEVAKDGSFVMTGYFGRGTAKGEEYPSGCISLTGTATGVTTDVKTSAQGDAVKDGTYLHFTVTSGYLYFTKNTSEYEKRAVAWELFEYGNGILEKMSQPAFSFSISSANFLCLEDFVSFKNRLRNGQKIYIELDEDKTIMPILIGVQYNYESISELELEFGDSFVSSDSSFRLADLLEQSVSMGKDVDLSKFTYSAFVNSGAGTKVHEFMTGALDVAKNNIMSSREQAITWGDSGIRLRRWTTEAHDAYAPEEVWMNNNSIMMTSNNWATAEIAIGQFKDANLGDCWGIVAPNVVGTLLAGSNLVIESEKKDGGHTVFRVDAEGCVLYNSLFDIVSGNKKTHISLDPDLGIAIGHYPVYTVNDAGDRVLNDDNANFWADIDGNLHLHGRLHAGTGDFDGKVTAREGYIGNGAEGWTIGSTFIYNGRPSYNSNAAGIYIGVDGISLGNGTHYVKASRDGLLSANNVIVAGNVTATSGAIGGFTIANGTLYNGLSSFNGGSNGVYIGPDGIALGGGKFKVDSSGNLVATSATITGNINATSGTFHGRIEAESGYFHGDITGASGTFSGRIEATDGYFRGTVYANKIAVGGDAGYIIGGQIGGDTITNGNIAGSTITGGKIAGNTISGGNIGYDTVGRSNLVEKYATSAQYNSLAADVAYFNRVITGQAVASMINTTRLTLGGYSAGWQTITVNGRSYRVMTGQ